MVEGERASSCLHNRNKRKLQKSRVRGFFYAMIIDHTHEAYKQRWERAGANQHNGAFYYSKEITRNIIPNVRTDRNWITVNIPGVGCDHAVVFIHNNLHPERYSWLAQYTDLVLVCGVPETVQKVSHLGKAIYLPLSIDTEEIRQYTAEEKTKEAAFVGRPIKKAYGFLPRGIDYLEGMPREDLLKAMAEYRTIYAVGRCAIEAKALGCKVKAYDWRFPNPTRWKVLDNREAAQILQTHLDEIDGGQTCSKLKERPSHSQGATAPR